MNDVVVRLGLGLLISAGIGLFAYRRGSLTASGAFGAIITGTTIFGFGGWVAGILLVAFFSSSTALSKFKARTRAKQNAERVFEKGSRRDIGQALANGGAAAGLAALAWLVQAPAAELLVVAMTGALATVNADTWATELGILNRRQPRLITTFQPAPAGTSGAISLVGTLAALAGALFIALMMVGLSSAIGSPVALALLWIVPVAGLLGALFDSLLGATVQAQYQSADIGHPTERVVDASGTPNRLTRGWRWLNNDWVNFIASLFGALCAAGLYATAL
jgi:uncharacterized protein (TIGR00297 family)